MNNESERKRGRERGGREKWEIDEQHRRQMLIFFFFHNKSWCVLKSYIMLDLRGSKAQKQVTRRKGRRRRKKKKEEEEGREREESWTGVKVISLVGWR